MAENHILLETIQLTQSASSVVFDNLPTSGYTDLKIVVSGRTDVGQGASNVSFNGVTSNLSSRIIFGIGSGTPGSATYSTLRAGYIVGTDYTDSTFANNEIYIPNYRSSSFKSVSVNSVTETNAAESYQMLVAGLWSDIAAITSITLTVINNNNGNASNFVANSTFSLYGIAALGTTPVTAPSATGGNIVANDGTYWYHAFLSSGTFTPAKALSCDILQIAGGAGGGGGRFTGGGGAGGLRIHNSQSLTATNYTVTVGAGGSSSNSGNNSQFDSLTVSNGGGTGGSIDRVGANGGSGGGGGGYTSNTPGSASPSGQGNNGGSGANLLRMGGGGGGAGAVGGASTVNGGNGGNGSTTYSSWGSATGTGQNSGGTYYYAGGGGGGVYVASGEGSAGTGGLGGGGNGISGNAVTGYAGTANTGGGGGGAGESAVGGAGGSGVVIVRYPMV